MSESFISSHVLTQITISNNFISSFTAEVVNVSATADFKVLSQHARNLIGSWTINVPSVPELPCNADITATGRVHGLTFMFVFT